MYNILVNIYHFFNKRKFWFIVTILVLIGFIVFNVSNIKLEENINAIIPHDKRIDDISLVLKNFKFSDQIILNFFNNDSNITTPDQLESQAAEITNLLKIDTDLIKNIRFKIDDNSLQNLYDYFYNNLPFYLTDDDYAHIKTQLTDTGIATTLEKDFKSLISPAGIVTKKYILKDPFSITPLALKKLQNFQIDNNFSIYHSCVFTKDKKNLLVFIEPKYPANNTKMNAVLIDTISTVINRVKNLQPNINIEYYGGTAVAVANAKRIKSDIILTVNIALVLIFFLLFLFFRKIKVLLLLFFPVVLGAGIALSIIIIVYGSISAIALGVGAILIGISTDYSLHIFTHFRDSGSVTKTLKDVALPILMSAGTTASAFLCLFVIRSEALNQLGLFSALSVTFTSLIVLLIVPVLLSGKNFNIPQKTHLSFLDKIASYRIDKNKTVLIVIILLTIVFAFTFRNIHFNSNITTLNYQPPSLTLAEKNLSKISSETNSAVYLVTVGKTLEEALTKTEKENKQIELAKQKKLFTTNFSATDLILTKEMQIKKIKQWNAFWDKLNRKKIIATLIEKGKQFKFKSNAFYQFDTLINKDFKPVSLSNFSLLQNLFLNNYINQKDSLFTVISVLKVKQENKNRLFKLFKSQEDVIIFDKQYFSNQFFKIIREDFNKLVILSMIIVFLILLVSFGRIELAMVTFIPILLSWFWILGIMGLFNIEFNIFNIIISSFIFGLGVDYSIFMMRGLLNNYKYGNYTIKPYKLSVLLSVLTTIFGVGVLIFAKHPALKSIALVSIFGIITSVIITYTIIPVLFTYLVSKKGKNRKEPLTAKDGLVSLLSFIFFLISSIILTAVIPIIYILPIPRKSVKFIFHYLICISSRIIVWINFSIKKEIINKASLDFSIPKVIVSNHQSHLDLVLLLRLNPKIIVITNKWVWYNPFYGFIVRFANYFPIHFGLNINYDNIKKKVKQGYSVLIFPEGTRTPDGNIKRFHQGAFKIAADLNLDIQPILLHGAFQCLPKDEFFMRSGHITQKVLKIVKVKQVNTANNETYRLQAKSLTKYFREEFDKIKLEIEDTKFNKRYIINQYVFKGPVLEWYVKIKLKLENNYSFINSVVPHKANIVDIGCGYGYLSLMLRNISTDRIITGFDFDENKIKVAANITKNDNGINFYTNDISKTDIPPADVYILSDVLHYMPKDIQISVLQKCFDNVSENGMIIVRDADADLEKRTKITKATEIQSTKIFKFNKTKYGLSFISGKVFIETAKLKGFNCQRIDNTKHTSNITYIFKRINQKQ